MKKGHTPKAKRNTPWVFQNTLAKSVVMSLTVAIALSAAVPARAGETRNTFLSKLFPVEACIGKIDWYGVGLSDGELGIEANYFKVYEQLCARKSRSPNRQAYFKGHELGLMSYCNPENIYQLAQTGAVTIGACKESSEIIEAMQRGFKDLL